MVIDRAIIPASPQPRVEVPPVGVVTGGTGVGSGGLGGVAVGD